MTINDAQFDTAQRIGSLLYRRLQETITKEERAELDGWLARQDHATRDFLVGITEWEEIERALQALYAIDIEAAFEDVQKKIELSNLPAATLHSSSNVYRLRTMRRAAAAAVIILAVGAGGVFYFNGHKKKIDPAGMPVTERFRNEVAPGGDKAVLQLADGSKIILDSVSNGELAKQGTTKIIKLEDGQLAYHSGGAAVTAISYNTISTPKGGQYQVTLPDGSKVWLNAASSLRFPTAFTGSARNVSLTGEAYFQVAQKASMPFRVEVPWEDHMLQVDVLGTEFNLMAYSDEKNQETTVLNGAVKVSAGSRQLVLDPGQQARVGAGSYDLKLVDKVNTEEVTAWKDGRFQFQDESIENIMRQVARWYNIDVVYEGKVQQQFTGKIPREVNLSTLLKILEATGWVHFMVDGKTITVMP